MFFRRNFIIIGICTTLVGRAGDDALLGVEGFAARQILLRIYT